MAKFDPLRDDPTYRTELWVYLFFGNLPSLIGMSLWDLPSAYESLGRTSAIVVIGVATFWIVRHYRTLAIGLCTGGMVLFFLQCIAYPCTAWLGNYSWTSLTGSGTPSTQIGEFIHGFMIALQTGQILVIFALIVGLILRKIIDAVQGNTFEPEDEIDDDVH